MKTILIISIVFNIVMLQWNNKLESAKNRLELKINKIELSIKKQKEFKKHAYVYLKSIDELERQVRKNSIREFNIVAGYFGGESLGGE